MKHILPSPCLWSSHACCLHSYSECICQDPRFHEKALLKLTHWPFAASWCHFLSMLHTTCKGLIQKYPQKTDNMDTIMNHQFIIQVLQFSHYLHFSLDPTNCLLQSQWTSYISISFLSLSWSASFLQCLCYCLSTLAHTLLKHHVLHEIFSGSPTSK